MLCHQFRVVIDRALHRQTTTTVYQPVPGELPVTAPIPVVLNQSQTPVWTRRCATWLVEHMLVLRPPGVYPPQHDTWLLAEVLRRDRAATGRRVLDLCTGTGALAVVAARAGAASITATWWIRYPTSVSP